MHWGAGGWEVSSLNAKSMRMEARSGNCTRSSLAAMRLRRCFSRRRFRAPSGPTVVNFMRVRRAGQGWDQPTPAGTTDVSTTTVSAAATTTAATAAGLVLGFVDFQRATAEVLAVQRLHRLLGVGARHFDEAEAARLARVTVVNQRDFVHVTVGREQGAHRVFGGTEGKISNVKFGQENT